jgi:ParB-like chromosome segregation protein Spo0J
MYLDLNENAMQITKLKVNDIVVKDRLRGVDSEKVARLKESILRLGLLHPITVSGGVLVAGLHRLTAFKELGIEEIDCHIVDNDELLQKEIEIDENLHRNELTVLERGKMEAIKKKHEEEWRKRQLEIEYFQTPEEVKYELAKIESIAPEAKEKLKGTPYENNKTFLLDLAELSKDYQVSVTQDLTIRDVENIVKNKVRKERYPNKDKNQIKFQLDDEHIEKANKLIKMYKWKSIPELAKRMVESYLNAFFKEDREPVDNEILEVFDDLTENLTQEEYQDVRRGSSI